MSLNKTRRLVLIIILLFFILQFLGLKILTGSLTGSVVVGFLSMIDVFAFVETLVSSKDLALQTIYAFIPVLIIYLIIGRAFCGWVCPMDFLFEIVSKIRGKFINLAKTRNLTKEVMLKKISYVIALALLVFSAFLEIPIFTNYLSHLTNFFRSLNSIIFAILSLPFEKSILIYSTVTIVALLILEAIYPRLWCKSLCPIGRTYGLFNKISLLKLSVAKDSCIHCEACDRECYMDVHISSNTDKSSIRDTNCILCGKCVESCKDKTKTLKLSFNRR
ncbi:MAG: 4Fe-4S binding protein [Thermodesulfovibrionales bacterium]|nr:4Fe-4S binding protein [Thermodesulfovibrionales bacterium]